MSGRNETDSLGMQLRTIVELGCILNALVEVYAVRVLLVVKSGHPLTALADNLSRGAASRHPVAQLSHTMTAARFPFRCG